MMYMPAIFEDFEKWMKPERPAHQLMRTDVKENENGYELAIDLPGCNKEDLKAQLKDGYLCIEASRSETNENQNENEKYLRRERFFGSCSRSFYVGEDLTIEDIKARFENGTLTVAIPKKEPVKQVEENHYIAIAG